MFQEISNGKQFWCSWKLAVRLVGQPTRWCQDYLVSGAAAILSGQGGHSLHCTNHKSASTTQAPNVFTSNREFILETKFGKWEMDTAEGTIHPSTFAALRGHRQGWRKFWVKQNKISSTSQEFQMASLYLFVDIQVKSEGQGFDCPCNV